MSAVAARLQLIVQAAHLLGRLDIDRTLRLDLLRPITGNKAKMANVLVQIGKPELDFGIRFEIVEPQSGEIRNEDVPWQVTVGESVKVIGCLHERAIEILAGAFVLDQQYALPKQVDPALFQPLAGTGHRDLFFENADTPTVDAEDVEEAVPETL